MIHSKNQSSCRELIQILAGWSGMLFAFGGVGVLLFSEHFFIAVGLFAVSVSAFAFAALHVPRLKGARRGNRPIDPIELKKWRESHPGSSIEQAIEACYPGEK